MVYCAVASANYEGGHDNDSDDSFIFRAKPHRAEQHQKQYENEAKVTVIHHERQVERHTDSRQDDKYP
jgi:hypothetical protein